MERRGQRLTTEDLAGTHAGDDDLRIEEDSSRTASDGIDERRARDVRSEAEGREGEPIAVGPVQDEPVILEERQSPGPFSDQVEHSPQTEDEQPRQGLPSDQSVATTPPRPGGGVPEKVDHSQEHAGGSTSEAAQEEGAGPLIGDADREEFTSRWKDVQFRFVEEPRSAVQEADGLVAEVMQRLAQTFADERGNLESQWSKGDQVSTEDLRVAFRRYRAFFDRLLET